MTNAAELHERAVVVDCHNDLLALVAHHKERGRTTYFRDHWLPELRRGGVDVQVLPVFVDDIYRPELSLRRALRLVECAHEIAAENPDHVALCRTGTAIDEAVEHGRIALVLALEGTDYIGIDLELFTTFFRLGVRVASFTHFGRTMLADGSAEDEAGSRLTSAGVAAVALMQKMGMLVDVSHLSRAGTDHVLEITTRPVIASHSSARALRDHHRNLSDEVLKAIAATGGVIGVNLFPWFLDDAAPTIERVVDHIEHIAAVAGIDHVGLGPDFVKEYYDTHYPNEDLSFEGLDPKQLLPGTEGTSRDLPLVTERLVDRGFADDEIVKILGGNFTALFRAELGIAKESR